MPGPTLYMLLGLLFYGGLIVLKTLQVGGWKPDVGGGGEDRAYKQMVEDIEAREMAAVSKEMMR